MDLKGDRKKPAAVRGDDGGGPSGPHRDLGASLSLVILRFPPPPLNTLVPPSAPPLVLPTENVDSRLPVPRSLVDTTSFSWHRQARQINI